MTSSSLIRNRRQTSQHAESTRALVGPRVWVGLPLVALWLLHVVANWYWLRQDTQLPTFDAALHSTWAMRMGRLPFLSQPLEALQGLLAPQPYPPLTYWVSVPFAYLLERNGNISAAALADLFVAVHATFLAVMLIATCAIGRRLSGRASVGLLAAALLSFYPAVYGTARLYLLDIPLVAMVTLSAWMLLRTENFERGGAAIWLGAALGCGMLTKWVFALFLVGPLLWVTLRLLRPRRQRPPAEMGQTRPWQNWLLALLVGAVVCGPWYVAHSPRLLTFVLGQKSDISRLFRIQDNPPATGSSSAAVADEQADVSSERSIAQRWQSIWASWTYYARALAQQQIMLPFLLAFLVGLLSLWYRTPGVGLLIVWIVVPYTLLSQLTVTDVRYTMPLLPAIAVLTALGWLRLASLRLGRAVAAAAAGFLLLHGLFQFAALSLPPSHRLVDIAASEVAQRALLVRPVAKITTASPPAREAWPVEALIDDVARDLIASSAKEASTVLDGVVTDADGEAADLLVLSNVAHFEPSVFFFAVEAKALPINTINVLRGTVNSTDEQLAASDYIITKTGDLGNRWRLAGTESLTEAVRSSESTLGNQFDQIATYPLADGSVGELYKRVANN